MVKEKEPITIRRYTFIIISPTFVKNVVYYQFVDTGTLPVN